MEYGLVLWWLVAYLALMAAGMPLVAALFPRLADRGAGFALPAALALVWVVVYLVGHVSLTAGTFAGLAVLAVAAAALAYRGVEFDWRLFGEAAAVFTVAFLFLIAVRSVDAGVHPPGGEKFLDFGLLKAILRADVLPPEDMWFAGRPVQYYYGGHLLAAVLTRVTGTDPRYGYNLALAGFYAMLVSAAFSLAGSIAASRGVSRLHASVFGAFFVGFASNLSTPGNVLDKGVGWLLGEGEEPFSYWGASRVIDGTINEFPLFAWLNGDLHAHMMSTPFVLLAAAVLFSYYRTPAERLTRRRLLVFGVLPPLAGMLAVVNTWSFPTIGGLALLTLALAPTDPTEMFSRTLAERVPRDDGWLREPARHVSAVIGAVAVVALGLLWSLPFWLGTATSRSLAFFPDRSSMLSLLAVHGVFVLFFALHLYRHAVPHLDDDRVDQVIVLLGLGVLLAWSGVSWAAVALLGPPIVIGWIVLRLDGPRVERAARRATGAARDAVSDRESPADATRASERDARTDGGTAATATDDVTESSRGAAGTSRSDAVDDLLPDPLGFETVLMIAGAGIVVLVEFVYVQEEAAPERMNTVFKAYADVWILWAVGAGAILAHLLDSHSPALALSGDEWRTVFRVLAAVVVVSTSVYGAVALANHFEVAGQEPGFYGHPDDPTLDGFGYVERRHGQELSAIQWFDDLEGQPNIVEAPGRDMYRWTNPISSLTGVPTLAGWAHERGYRGSDVYVSRADDADTIYTGSAAQRAYLLDYYDIEYVYVGSNERGAYAPSEIEVFDSMGGVTLEEEWGPYRVYRVDSEHLDVPEDGN